MCENSDNIKHYYLVLGFPYVNFIFYKPYIEENNLFLITNFINSVN